jgi:hypothetical protein
MFNKKAIIDPIQKEYEYLELLTRKLELYNFVRSSFTRYYPNLPGNLEVCHLSEEWMIKKILGNEFLEEYRRTMNADKPPKKCINGCDEPHPQE